MSGVLLDKNFYHRASEWQQSNAEMRSNYGGTECDSEKEKRTI